MAISDPEFVFDDAFYARLKPISDLNSLSDPGHFLPAPASWHMIVTDVVDSSAALQAGRYKDVNVVGALGIVALLNAAESTDLPYAFGGDGATILIPESVRADAEDVLIDVKRRARDDFGLDLRIGIVPIRDLYAEGESVLVARWEAPAATDKPFAQALFLGNGLLRAEQWIKSVETAHKYELTRASGIFQADYTGFSCRWREIPSPHVESVCLLVRMRGIADPAIGYRSLLEKIEKIYGDAQRRHPITPEGLRPSLLDKDLEAEARVMVSSDSKDSNGTTDTKARRRAQTWKMRMEVVITNLWVSMGKQTSGERTRRWFPRADVNMAPMDWGRFKDYLVDTSDCQKLDGALRMIMSGYPAQRENLQKILDAEYKAGNIFYGMHASSGALMTCLVYQPNGRQVHFVDGSDGGYALAAQAMKTQYRAG